MVATSAVDLKAAQSDPAEAIISNRQNRALRIVRDAARAVEHAQNDLGA